jgi:hypothetical protein
MRWTADEVRLNIFTSRARHLAETFDLELTRDREEEPVTEPVALNR